MNDLSCGGSEGRFFRFVTMRAFGRRTDSLGQTDGHFAHGYTVRCITCSRRLKMIQNTVDRRHINL